MPPSVNRSNAKHYSSDTVTEFHEFPGRSNWTCGEDGWEEVADHALDWAVAHATGAEVTAAATAWASCKRRSPSRRPHRVTIVPDATAYGLPMDDAQIHATIEQLVAEEHELWNRQGEGMATEGDRRRLEEVKVSLDRCWDLLRQRRALREFGGDPDIARARPEDTVERYEQ